MISDYTVLKPNKASHHLAGIKPTSCNHQKRAKKEMPINMRRNQAPSHKLINFEIKDATAQGSLPFINLCRSAGLAGNQANKPANSSLRAVTGAN